MSHLVRMFQELTHYYNELAFRSVPNEEELFNLLDGFTILQQQSLKTKNELDGNKRILLTYERDLAHVRLENKELRGQLVHLRTEKSALNAAREEIEKQKRFLEEQVDTARRLFRDEPNLIPEYSRQKFQFLNERPSATILPHSRVSSIAYAVPESDESMETSEDYGDGGFRRASNRVKRSISLTNLVPSAPDFDDDQTPCKRARDDTKAAGEAVPKSITEYQDAFRSPMNRSFSEPRYVNNGRFLQIPGGRVNNVADLATLSPITARGTGRPHTFSIKLSMKAETCDCCDRRFMFGMHILRCDVCKLQCHNECQASAVVPCIPRGTPTTKNQRGKLHEFVPRDPPMVPNIVVHCVNEMERRGLTYPNMYRQPGSETQVVELLDKFLYGRGMPNLRQITDINVLCSCVKRFLMNLTEPLIPSTSFNEFNTAVELMERGQDVGEVLGAAITDLPQPNRDTLAFLMIHWQKLISQSDSNKMSDAALATCLAPTVCGTGASVADLLRNEKHENILKMLFRLEPEYWGRFLSKGDAFYRGDAGSTISGGSARRDLGSSLLGPMPGLPSTTPKSTLKIRNARRNFFNPPWKS